MPAFNPEDCDRLLYQFLQDGDLDAALELYEPDAVFVVPSGEVVRGTPAIRTLLEGMASGEASGRLEAVTSVMSADGSLAFTRTRGSSRVPGPDGQPITTRFHSVEVLRKQPDGSWRIVIDDPGGEGLG
jgi:uncharacterized protein (TIGR02246 family)